MRLAITGARTSLCMAAALTAAAGRAAEPPRDGWSATWASSQIVPQPHEALLTADLSDATLRQVVRVSAGGMRLRVRLSNMFGSEPLRLDAVHLARAATPGSARITSGTDRALRFAGRSDVVIPAGADYLSDPIVFPVAPLTRLAVTIHFAAPPIGQTGHPGSRTTSWIARGNQTAALDLPAAKPVDRWYALSGIEVEGARGAIAILGDSITDGYGVTTNRDERWPDILAQRLQADPATRGLAVLNQGIGGNRLLLDGIGPNALARLDRDVLAQAGVRHLILLVGVNDLGTLTRDNPVSVEEHAALVARMIGGYAQIVARARAHGIRVIGGTITPFGGSDYYHPDAANEADRQVVNRWIRAPGNFDAVIDFDAALRDARRPDRLDRTRDSGDHLHPSREGYRAMAAAVPLALFGQ